MDSTSAPSKRSAAGSLPRPEMRRGERFRSGSRLKSCFDCSNRKLQSRDTSALQAICYDEAMKNVLLAAAFLVCSLIAGGTVSAQAGNGALDLVARITPTAARPEPVRQFTFYVLTKSYEDITKDVEASDAPPDRDKFISELKVSDELKEWLKGHDELDLTSPDLDKTITPDDVLHVPEFLLAYQRANSGGVTYGIPKPKYADADKTAHPDRYQKQHDEYFVALKKFIQTHPESMSGVELELSGINPQSKWVS